MTTEKPKSGKPDSPSMTERGRKGAEVTRLRNFRHPSGDEVVHDMYVRITASEDEVIRRLSGELGMSKAGIVRMALYLFADDYEKMSKLAEDYRSQVAAK